MRIEHSKSHHPTADRYVEQAIEIDIVASVARVAIDGDQQRFSLVPHCNHCRIQLNVHVTRKTTQTHRFSNILEFGKVQSVRGYKVCDARHERFE